MYVLFLEIEEPFSNTIYFDDERKYNTFYVDILCYFMKQISN